MKFNLTQAKSDRTVNKVFPKSKENRDNHFVSGFARTMTFSPESFLQFLNKSDPFSCIITGLNKSLSEAESNCLYELESRRTIIWNSEHGYRRTFQGKQIKSYSKTKDNFSYDFPGNGILHIDMDYKIQAPYIEPDELLKIIEGYIPEIVHCTKIVKYSSSNVTSWMESSKKNPNYHIYIIVPMQQIIKIGSYLFKRMMIDYGYIYNREKTGSQIEGCYIDGGVFSPERVIYTAPPTISNDLKYHHKAYIIKGVDEPTANGFDLDTNGLESKYREAVRRLKVENKPIQEKLKAERKQTHMANGKSEEQAQKLVDFEVQEILTLDHEVLFDDYGWLTIREAIKRNLKGATCADPIEYDDPKNGGPNKAMLRYYQGDWSIKTFIHGNKITYKIVLDALSVAGLENYSFKAPDTKEALRIANFLERIEPKRTHVKDIIDIPIENTIVSFSDRMVQFMKDLDPNYTCSDANIKCFDQFSEVYNRCMTLNDKGETATIVVPASTGSCKTKAAVLFLAEISKLGKSGLLVVAEVNEAIALASEINQILYPDNKIPNDCREDMAGVYYRISPEHHNTKERREATDLPRIAVITHAMYRSRSKSPDAKRDEVRLFNNNQRDLIIIDEEINLLQTETFTTKELRSLTGILGRDTKLNNFVKDIKKLGKMCSVDEQVGKISQEERSKLDELAKCIDEHAIDIQNNIYDIANPIKGKGKSFDDIDEVEIGNILSLLGRLTYVISGDFTRIPDYQDCSCHREKYIGDKFGSVVVLDATASLNREYLYRIINQKAIIPYKRIECRNYENVNLHLCTKKGLYQSKYSIYKQPKKENKVVENANNYINMLKEVIKDGDKMLVATYKSIIPTFESLNPYGDPNGKRFIKFVNWGSQDVRGSNQYREFNKACVIGFFRKPKSFYSSVVAAIADSETYRPKDTLDKDLIVLEDDDIMSGIVQFVNRTRCRSVIDKKGNCPITDLYMFSGTEDMAVLIKDTFKKQMRGIKIKEWILGFEPPKSNDKKRGVGVKTANQYGAILKLLGNVSSQYKEITLKDISDQLGIEIRKLTRMVKTESFMQDLSDFEDIRVDFVAGNRGHSLPRFIFQ